MAVLSWALVVTACTEPNPYLDPTQSTGTTAASSSSTGPNPDPSSGPTTSTSTGTQDDSSSGPPPPACADMGMECVPAAPEGFSGPFAWLEHELDDGARPSCPAPFDEPLVEAFSTVLAPAAGCGCDCGAYSGGTCPTMASVEYTAGAACGAVTATQNLGQTCVTLPGGGWSSLGSYYADVPPVQGGGCLALPEVVLDPAVFLTRHLACGGSFPAMGCAEGELCAPPPTDPLAPRWCVWQAGDVACPEGPYGERTLLHQGIDDTRGCEPCTCAKPTTPCQNTSVVVSTSTNCSILTGALLPNVCTNGFGGAALRSLIHNPGTPAGSCTPAEVVPTGDAAGSDPVTFCCTSGSDGG